MLIRYDCQAYDITNLNAAQGRHYPSVIRPTRPTAADRLGTFTCTHNSEGQKWKIVHYPRSGNGIADVGKIEDLLMLKEYPMKRDRKEARFESILNSAVYLNPTYLQRAKRIKLGFGSSMGRGRMKVLGFVKVIESDCFVKYFLIVHGMRIKDGKATCLPMSFGGAKFMKVYIEKVEKRWLISSN
ncbi:hypothetical protein SCA6_007466 [Theobroma cacao]